MQHLHSSELLLTCLLTFVKYTITKEYGGVETARRLLAKELTDGFTKLWEKGRLDLSVEALVLKPEFALLFNEDERKQARDKLAEYRYKAPRYNQNVQVTI